MPQFLIDSKSIHEGVAALDAKESHHALSVFRLKIGDAMDLFDGQGRQFRGVVLGVRDGLVSVSVIEDSKPPESNRCEISLGVAVIRPERMEWLIQKACELGVSSLWPLTSERSLVNLSSERWESKIKRWNKIALASCKQCGRSTLPIIHPVIKFDKALALLNAYDRILIPTLALPGQPLSSTLQNHSDKKIIALVGPEGDFTAKEVQMAVHGGALPVRLGHRILRSETAALYVLSVLNFYYENG